MKLYKHNVTSATNSCGIPAAPSIIESDRDLERPINPPDYPDGTEVSDSDYFIPIKIVNEPCHIDDETGLVFENPDSIISKIDVYTDIEDDFGNSLGEFKLDDPEDVLNNLEECLYDKVFVDADITPGRYSVSADVDLIYTVSGITTYENFEYSDDLASSEYSVKKSFVNSVDCVAL